MEFRKIINDYNRLERQYKTTLKEADLYPIFPLHQRDLRYIIDNYKKLFKLIKIANNLNSTNNYYQIIEGISTTKTLNIWLKGSGNIKLKWLENGDITDITLTSTSTLYSYTYLTEVPNVQITNPNYITDILIDGDNDFTLTISYINQFTSLINLVNINNLIIGNIGLLNISSLKILNLGYQVDNTLLTGDIGEILNNNLYTIFSVNGGEFTYFESVTQVEEDSNIILENTNLSNAEIDQLLIDFEAIGTDPFELSIIGDNGYKTATSDTEYDQLITNGCTIELNNQPITSISYSNTGQTFTEDVAITPMILTSIPDVSANQVLEFFGTLPTGLSINSSTGTITGTPTIIDETNYVVRCRAYGIYTGFADIELTFNITSGVVAPTVTSTAASDITTISATLAGNVTSDGGSTVTERGIVYALTSVNANPEIGGTGVTKDTNGTGTGVFSESITGLTNNLQYSFKAYAINAVGTSYGSALTLTTTAAKTYNINLGSSVTIANTEDPSLKYWNMLFGTSGTVSNIVDQDNTASSIDVAITNAFDAVSDFDGRQPTDLVYPNKAWRAVMTISAGTGVVEISSLPNTSYTVILGVSRNTTGTRIGLYTVNGASQTLDAILNPPQTITFTGVVPSSGIITITTAINSGSIAAHLNFIKIIG